MQIRFQVHEVVGALQGRNVSLGKLLIIIAGPCGIGKGSAQSCAEHHAAKKGSAKSGTSADNGILLHFKISQYIRLASASSANDACRIILNNTVFFVGTKRFQKNILVITFTKKGRLYTSLHYLC